MSILIKISKTVRFLVLPFVIVLLCLDYRQDGVVSDINILTLILVIELRHLGSKIMCEYD